jgi:crotonobetainyl-CoA:carnitine CoA-transferase CaiB-like acyl-CoA transferase
MMLEPDAYTGLTVLDMSQGVAGPYCATMLGLQGAAVVKVEPPGGDWIRVMGGGEAGMTPLAVTSNLGKRSLCVDARQPAGRAVIERLAARADVLVENFRPGVMARLGLDAPTLCARHPALVYLSVTGFGGSGPWADKAGTDSVLQAYTGLAVLNRESDGRPRRMGMLVPDTISALYAVQAVGAALFARTRTGRGRHLQISLAECCAAFQAAPIFEDALFEGRYKPPTAVPSGVFSTADGYITLLVLRQDMWLRLCPALGRAHWVGDARYADNASRGQNAAALNAEIAQVLATQPSAHWIAALEAADVLCAQVQDYAQFREHAQTQHMGTFGTLTQAPYAPLPMPYLPGTPRGGAIRPAPAAGQHSHEVLAELGYGPADIAALEQSGVVTQQPVP